LACNQIFTEPKPDGPRLFNKRDCLDEMHAAFAGNLISHFASVGMNEQIPQVDSAGRVPDEAKTGQHHRKVTLNLPRLTPVSC
jgi:hypothetical protein